MFDLIVVVLATSLHSPKPRPALRVTLSYPTQYTCNNAETRLDIPAIAKAYMAKHRGSKVSRVETYCEPNEVVEPDRQCAWGIECSNAINRI